MNFRKFLEAKFDPSVTHLQKFNNGTKSYIGNTYNLKIDNKGNVVQLAPEDYQNHRFSYYAINPQGKEIACQRTSPQSSDFKKLIDALRIKYNDIKDWNVQVYMQAGHMQTGNGSYNRTVGYWIGQPSVQLENNTKTYLYHGTSTNLWYDGIKKNGLLPRQASGSSGSYGAQNLDALSQGKLIYLSTHPDAAARTAAEQAAHKHGGQPMIIRILASGLFSSNFHPDEDSRQASAQHSINQMSVLAYEGKIPPSIIEPFLLGARADTGKRIVTKWTKFVDVKTTEHPLTTKLANNELPYTSDPEYFALKDAGILKLQRTYDANGFSRENVIKTRNVSDEEVKEILRKAYWTQNVKAILNDLNNAYKGAIYQLKDHPIPEKINHTLQMLIDSQIINIETYKDQSYFTVCSYACEDKAIALAKLMGKTDFGELAKQIKELDL